MIRHQEVRKLNKWFKAQVALWESYGLSLEGEYIIAPKEVVNINAVILEKVHERLSDTMDIINTELDILKED